MSGFLETKAGFWLLTTVLAGAFATGMTALQQHLNRDEIIKREAADRARRDTETLIKLGPMLTSDNRSQIDVALVLLTGLASREAVESSIAAQVESLIKSTLGTPIVQARRSSRAPRPERQPTRPPQQRWPA